MKHNVKRFVTLTMATLLVFGGTMTSYAAELTQDSTQDSAMSVETTAVQESTFTVTLPQTIALDIDSDTRIGTKDYTVKVVGDIAGDEIINVSPMDACLTADGTNFEMTSPGNANKLIVDVIQPKTTFTYDVITGAGETTTGSLRTETDVTAGEWTGNVSFNISLEKAAAKTVTITSENAMELLGLDANKYDIVIPSTVDIDGETYTVTEIGDGAFSCYDSDFDDITSVYIPGTVKKIGAEAFADWTCLTSVDIENGVEIIGDAAFAGAGAGDQHGCSISIPDSVTSIGKNAFINVKHISYNGPASGAPWGALAIN